MGTVHSGKISHLTWTFPKKYWAVLGCTGLYWAVLGHLRYLLGNVKVKWRILPLCSVLWEQFIFFWKIDTILFFSPEHEDMECGSIKYKGPSSQS